MPITVYTYHDPYKLKENTNLWKEISSCPYFWEESWYPP